MQLRHIIIGGSIVIGSSLCARVAAAEPQTIMRQPTAELFFAFDSYAVDATSKAKLEALLAVVEDAPSVTLVLDAHADPRGTGPYNVGLSLRRAVSVRDELIAAGIDADRIIIAAYGEDAKPRETFAEDRRVSISLTEDPLFAIIDQSLGATTVVWDEPVTLAEIEGPPDAIEQTAIR